MKTKNRHHKKYVIHFFYCCLLLANSSISIAQISSLRIKNATDNDIKVKEFGLQLSKGFASGNDIVFLNII